MIKLCPHKAAMLFAIFFTIIVVAPSIIVSIDEKAEVTLLFGEGEEEEENENLKILFKIVKCDVEDDVVVSSFFKDDTHAFKSYKNPYLNLVLPPPDYNS